MHVVMIFLNLCA